MPTLTGHFGKPLESMATILAESSEFQTWVDADDATEAREHIHFYTNIAANWTRPLVVLSLAPQTQRMKEASGSKFGLWVTGGVHIRFEQAADQVESTPHEQGKDFIETVDELCDVIAVVSGTGTYVALKGIGPADDIGYKDEAEGEDEPFFSWLWTLTLDT